MSDGLAAFLTIKQNMPSMTSLFPCENLYLVFTSWANWVISPHHHEIVQKKSIFHSGAAFYPFARPFIQSEQLLNIAAIFILALPCLLRSGCWRLPQKKADIEGKFLPIYGHIATLLIKNITKQSSSFDSRPSPL